MQLRPLLFLAILVSAQAPWHENRAAESTVQIGVAKADITPAHPIRLSGYGNRRTESEGAAQRLWAKAIAITDAGKQPAVLVAVDNCGVPQKMTDEVAALVGKKTGLPPERLAICSTHTHTGPCLSGVLPNLFSQEIPKDHQERIDQYSRELTERLVALSLDALKNQRPGSLAWGQGRVSFAQNRRTAGGPVDHALPVLRASDSNQQVRAVLVNYACHCTTLTGEFNQLHGDWAGCAQESIERDFPGAVALVAIGCGADANPAPRGQLDHARQQGDELAREVKRVLSSSLAPLPGPIDCQSKTLLLPFDPLPSRAQWEERARKEGIVGYHARVQLARLDRGETLPATLSYRVQTWSFGSALAMVFLPGEVVVDYALRLKQEMDGPRLWINAYANDVPCYIPSRRILREGGYEAEGSLWYYDRPARLAPEVEDMIVQTVRELVPKAFHSPAP